MADPGHDPLEVLPHLRILRVFAEATARGPGTPAIEPLLSPLHPIFPGEFSALGKRWPQMQAFLEAHSLV